ncbi:MAG: hypothetical protein M1833_000683 [Piccolia ochrophora]|nr:MAG: hypothetical protein M1833_000683 [Piccolia ochrophora]
MTLDWLFSACTGPGAQFGLAWFPPLALLADPLVARDSGPNLGSRPEASSFQPSPAPPPPPTAVVTLWRDKRAPNELVVPSSHEPDEAGEVLADVG